MDKKLFVVLEQGNKCNTDLSIEHKNQFSDDYCDWYRLNWKNDTNDNLASFYEENIVWSEGRSLLFEKVKNQYEYYIFIDDDVKFISKTNLTVAEEIKNFLETYHPLTGTIYGDNWAWNTYKNNIENDQKDAFPIMGHDLCCQIFQNDFANLMFPVYFHGSEKSMWYAQYIGYKFYPEKCIVLNKVAIKNTEHLPHHDISKTNYNNGLTVCNNFANIIINEINKKEFLSWNNFDNVLLTNQHIYNNEISKEKVVFTKEMLNKLINY